METMQNPLEAKLEAQQAEIDALKNLYLQLKIHSFVYASIIE